MRLPPSHLLLLTNRAHYSLWCRQDEFAATGVSGELFSTIDKALDERTIGHNPERLCLLKGGIIYSNAVTTVSPNYANETLLGGAWSVVCCSRLGLVFSLKLKLERGVELACMPVTTASPNYANETPLGVSALQASPPRILWHRQAAPRH